MTSRFHLDKPNGKLLGVCSGIANHFSIDPLLIRVGFVFGTLAFGLPLIAYFTIAIIAD